MSKNGPIAFLDSGIGGLPYLDWVSARMPSEHYIYVADTANFPYGEKSVGALRRIVAEIVRRIIAEFTPRAVVLACNTASVVALETLRGLYDVPFVGVVPAVKPAAERSAARRIGLLATSRTVADAYTEELIRSFASGCEVTRIGDGALVEFVEHRLLFSDSAEKKAVVADAARRLAEARVDTVVVGCTHFVYIEDALADALGPWVQIFDSREGVGKQIMKVAPPDGSRLSMSGTKRFYVTSAVPDGDRYTGLCRRFGIDYRGMLEVSGRNG